MGLFVAGPGDENVAFVASHSCAVTSVATPATNSVTSDEECDATSANASTAAGVIKILPGNFTSYNALNKYTNPVLFLYNDNAYEASHLFKMSPVFGSENVSCCNFFYCEKTIFLYIVPA